MPELRKDPIIGRWVIISTERGKRPIDFKMEKRPARGGFCPFCPGNEDKTPPEVLAYRDPHTAPDTAGWTVRVVPNKFPALQIEGELDKRGDGIYDMMRGVGAHEVLIESPDHKLNLAYLPDDHVESIFWALRDRCIDLKKDSRFRYILVFKNWGEEAGASLEHSHFQIIATPIIPKRAIEELDGAKFHWSLKERCIFCDLLKQEIQEEKRIIHRNEHFIAIAPYASRFPFETWVMPLRHVSAFEKTPTEWFSSLAGIMKTVIRKLDIALDVPPFNFIIHTAPAKTPDLDYYHWHIEIMPKLTKVAGFEWGSGFYINPTPPEVAAEALRAIDVDAPAVGVLEGKNEDEK
ncbi:MAG: galactose-1-phosphate uridylyltransferase [Candidatus Krumholzibacteriota bacterium]|nr:galactose-1-phosphate uridylyltransferase [Candidatus Krumholzibacteriota bacterium]